MAPSLHAIRPGQTRLALFVTPASGIEGRFLPPAGLLFAGQTGLPGGVLWGGRETAGGGGGAWTP